MIFKILLVCVLWFSIEMHAGSVDRFAIKFVCNSAFRLLKNYPLITGAILAVIFRHQLIDFLFGEKHKNLFSIIGEHPFLSFASGAAILYFVLNPISSS